MMMSQAMSVGQESEESIGPLAEGEWAEITVREDPLLQRIYTSSGHLSPESV